MKQFKLLFMALTAITLISCEQAPAQKDLEAHISYEINSANIITFKAEYGKQLTPFIWWIDGKMAYLENEYSGNQLVGDNYAMHADSIKLHGESGKTYKVTVRCYDKNYDEHYASLKVSVQ